MGITPDPQDTPRKQGVTACVVEKRKPREVNCRLEAMLPQMLLVFCIRKDLRLRGRED